MNNTFNDEETQSTIAVTDEAPRETMQDTGATEDTSFEEEEDTEENPENDELEEETEETQDETGEA